MHTPKLETDWYFKVYGKKIVSSYRKRAIDKFGKEFFSADNNYGAPVPVKGNRTSEMPIFWEFAQYVKATIPSRMDEHWRPMSTYCSLCAINYDNVIKFENMDREGHFLKTFLDPAFEDVSDRWMNPNSVNGLKKDDLVRKYFDMLSNSDITALYKIYEMDFKLFGYTFTYKNITLPY